MKRLFSLVRFRVCLYLYSIYFTLTNSRRSTLTFSIVAGLKLQKQHHIRRAWRSLSRIFDSKILTNKQANG